MDTLVSFDLSDAEIQQLRDLNWRNGRVDLMCQTIVRDYLLRKRLKAERIARKIDRAASVRRVGL